MSTATNDPTLDPANVATAQAAGTNEIVFVDKGIADWQTLVDGASNGAEVVLLETDQDGLAQMAEYLQGRSGVDAVHVLSHGTTGAVQLGETWLSTETLDARRDALTTIGDALTTEGDLLLYGCNVASDGTGEAFIDNLAAITGADVAASDDLTGSAHLDGDETLEIHAGTIEADYILSTSSEYLLSPGNLLNFDNGTVTDNSPNNFVHNGFTLSATTNADIVPYNIFLQQMDLTITAPNNGFILSENASATFALTSFDGFQSVFGGGGMALDVAARDSSNSALASHTFSLGDANTNYSISGTPLDGVSADNFLFTWSDDIAHDLRIDNIQTAVPSSNAAPGFDQDTDNNGTLSDSEAGGAANLTIAEDSGAFDISGFLRVDDSDTGDTQTWSVNGGDGADNGTLDISGSATGGTDMQPGTATYTPNANFAGDDTFTIDVSDGTDTDSITVTVTVNDAPEVISINRGTTPGSETTNADTVEFDVTFSEAVSGIDTGDFALTTTGGASGSIDSVSVASGTTVTVTVGSVSSDGTIRLDLSDDDTITSQSNGVAVGGVGTSGAGDGSRSGDQTFTIDNTAPVLQSFARQTPAASPTNAGTLVFRATFDGDVSNVDAADFAVTGTTATVTGVSSVSASVYDVTVSGGDLAGFTGAVGLDLAGGQNIADAAGNALAGSEPATDETYTLDNTAPTAASISRQTPADETTNADSLVFRVTFDEDVQSVGGADFTVTGTTATATGVSAVTGSSVYDVTVSGGDLASLDGTVGLNFAGGQDIQDTIGNAFGGAEPGTDETYTLDNTAPGAPSITTPIEGDNVVNAAEDQDVLVLGNGADANATVDVSIDDSNTGTTAVTAQVTADGSGNWTLSGNELDITGLDDGILTVSVTQADAVGNTSTAATQNITYDATLPTIAGAIAPSVSTVSDAQVGTDTFTLTIDFNEAMDTTVNPTVSFPIGGENPTAVGNTVATLSNADGSWTDNDTYVVTFDVADDNIVINNIDVRVTGAQDAAGNTMTADTQTDIFSVITTPAPVVQSITSTSADDTYGVGDSVNVTVTFDEAVDFTANGGALQVTLSNGETLTLASGDATNQTAFSGTYTIGEGDTNSADLNVTAVSLTGGATLVANDDGVLANTNLPSGNNLADNEALVIDANTPSVSAPDLAAASDSGTSDSDDITNDATPTITGTTEGGATVDVRVGGASVGTTTADGAGAWSFTFDAGDLSEGANTVDITASDAVNTSSDSGDLTITLDTGAPTGNDDSSRAPAEDATADDLGSLDVTANDTDAAGAIAATDITGSNGGRLDVAASGSVSFDANGDFEDLASGATRDTDFTVTVTDVAGNTATSTLSVTVTGVNDAPVLTVGTAPTVDTGASTTLDTALLAESDPDDDGAALTYTLTSAPSTGTLYLSGTELAVNDTFTQQNVVDGNLVFTAGGSAGTASFDVTLSDGDEDGAGDATGTVEITVENTSAPSPPPAPDPAPEPEPEPQPRTTEVDGATVTKSTTGGAGGQPEQTTVIEPVPEDREDDPTTPNVNLADVPVGNGTDGDSDLTLGLPTGVGATVVGQTRQLSGQDAVDDLIARIRATASGEDDAEMTDDGQSFLGRIPADGPITVRSITPSFTGNGVPGTIELSGADDPDNFEAVVLDVSDLPSGTVINLSDVDYISIVGGLTITGGPGNNQAAGDSSAQIIVLGPGDDSLSGGGGDDTVGSLGGDDQLFGGTGDDVVQGGADEDTVDGGSGNDTIEGEDGDDILIAGIGDDILDGGAGFDVAMLAGNREDYVVAIAETGADNFDAMRLHQVLLGRAPDAIELGAALDTLESGEPLAAVADQILRSTEFVDASGALDAEGVIGLLYRQGLGREPDPGGAAFWLGRLEAGASEAQVAAAIARSAEAVQTLGFSAIGEAEALASGPGIAGPRGAGFYKPDFDDGGAVLAVSETSRGFTLSANAAGTKTPRGTEMFTFDNGGMLMAVETAAQAEAARLFNVVFGQTPDAGEAAALMQRAGPGAEALLDDGAAGLNELDDEAFIGALYDNTFDRDPDAGGEAFWLSTLENGASRADVARAFADSAEAALTLDYIIIAGPDYFTA